MVNRKHVVSGGAALAAVAILLLLFFPTRERQVKKAFRSLEDWVRVEGQEPPLEMVGKVRAAERLFADPVSFRSDAYEVEGRFSPKDAGTYGVRWRSRFQKLDLEFYDYSITFPGDGEALAVATAHLSGSALGGASLDEIHELHCTLRKDEEGWQFARFELVQVLDR